MLKPLTYVPLFTRAMRFVRHHAPAHGLDPHRVGIIGFSAGGHLASTIATHFDSGDPTAKDPIEREPSRPCLHVLLYPVITMLAGRHPSSHKNLLGENPSPEAEQLLSNHLHVTSQTPPAFLVHAIKDQAVAVMHSDLYAEALQKAGVPHEYMRGDFGDHGFALQPFWTAPCATWLCHRRVASLGPFDRVKRLVECIGRALRRLLP